MGVSCTLTPGRGAFRTHLQYAIQQEAAQNAADAPRHVQPLLHGGPLPSRLMLLCRHAGLQLDPLMAAAVCHGAAAVSR